MNLNKWFGGKCRDCIFSIDLGEYYYCVLNGIYVGETDVCSQYLNRVLFVKFIEGGEENDAV